jgi:hypothetical protein
MIELYYKIIMVGSGLLTAYFAADIVAKGLELLP